MQNVIPTERSISDEESHIIRDFSSVLFAFTSKKQSLSK